MESAATPVGIWRWRIPLAAAASLAIVAGAWWFNQRPDAALGLRVAEVRGTVAGVRVGGTLSRNAGLTSRGRISDLKSEISESSAVEGGSHKALRVGDVLRPGDGIDVGADGYAKLAYPDRTQVELRRNTRLRVTLGVGRVKDAKRLVLDGGTLVCTAAPQKIPFEIATRHAVSRIVGTRFRLTVADILTTLAVLEGKVDLCQGEKVLEVGVGQEAAATDEGMKMQPVTLTEAPAGRALGQGGRVYAWGGNHFGQLGDGTTNNSAKPVLLPGLDGVTDVAAGYQHTMAIKSDRTVWTWGDNRYGQLGIGTTNNSSMPVAVPGLDGVSAVAAGAGHSVARKADQTVWAWGDNRYGQLGTGTTNNSVLPVAVLGLDGVIAVAAGATHTVAVKNDRTVWAWGNNGAGQLGDGTTTPRFAPVQVRMKDGIFLTGVIAVVAGDRHTVALRDDHTVWSWGHSLRGAVGNVGNGHDVLGRVVAPMPVPGLAGIIAIAAGRQYTLALADGGGVLTWGNYGIGEVSYASKPVKTADSVPLSGIATVSAGDRHAVAVKSDDTIWAWGANEFGQLGDGTTLTAATIGQEPPPAIPTVPVKLLDGRPPAGVTAIAAGGGHTVIVVGGG